MKIDSSIKFAAKAAQQAADEQATELSKECGPVPAGLPASVDWTALGTHVSTNTRYEMFRNGIRCEDQYEMQAKRLSGQRLPTGVECRKVVRQARYLLVQGNAVIAESDLRKAGYPDAFAGSATWVMLEYIAMN